jgi:excisionase family DNA binding protein
MVAQLHPATGSDLGDRLKRKRTIRTTEITIETEERVLLRAIANRRAYTTWCTGCGKQVEMVTPEHAAEIADVTLRTIYRWIDAGNIHFVENGGQVLVCLPALSSCAASLGASGSMKQSQRGKP